LSAYKKRTSISKKVRTTKEEEKKIVSNFWSQRITA